MQKTNTKTKPQMNAKVLAAAGVLIAMNIVLARLLAIPIGSTLRITVSATPIFLSGLWFGPIVGGLCGGISDLVGCILQGYAPNPLILVTSVLNGVIPALMFRYVFKNKLNYGKVLLIVLIHGIIGSLGFTALGLHLYYGTPWSVLYTTRLIQTVALIAANSVLVNVLYESPLTDFVTRNFFAVPAAARKQG
ncbi:MAG: folate family ECF transporter S component [Lachnospiraceae bacterium]|nr:folate family ECF transporter S component [Lachnospiraceae bacterium]